MTLRDATLRLAATVALSFALAAVGVIAGTVVRYARGTERLPDLGFGYPSREALNLDREFGVFPVVNGCFGSGARALARRLERATFVRLVRTLGPMKGSYFGPYPTKEEAKNAVRSDRSHISGAEWASGSFQVRGQTVQLPELAVRRVNAGRDASLEVALVGTCLLIGLDRGETHEIHLIDLKEKGWFAAYRYK